MDKKITKNGIIAIITMLLLAIYNGVFIQFYNTKDMKWNKWFHIIGWLIRGLIIIQFWQQWLSMLILLNIAWTLWDMIIAKIMGQSIIYIGKTAWIDKTFGYWTYFPKLLILILLIVLIFVN